MISSIPKQMISEMDIYGMKPIYNGKNGIVRKYSETEVLKIISEKILRISESVSQTSKSIIERNILQANRYNIPEEFYIPTSAVYTENGFVGYTQEYFRGNNIIDHYNSLFPVVGTYTLNGILEPYKKLNSALKRTPMIVCPDIATSGNVLVDDYDYIAITDYAGLQIGRRPSTDISCQLISQYKTIQEQVQDNLEYTKYMDKDLFTKELDKRSLLIMLLRDILNVDLPRLELVANIAPFDLRKRKLLEIKLKLQIIAVQLSNLEKEAKEIINKRQTEELEAIKKQHRKIDYDYFISVLNLMGIENNTHLMNAILNMSDEEKENSWIDNILDELESDYILENKGRVRRLIKK